MGLWQLEVADVAGSGLELLRHVFLGLYISNLVIRSGSCWLAILNMLLMASLDNAVKSFLQAWPSFIPYISNDQRYQFFTDSVWVPVWMAVFLPAIILFRRVTKRRMVAVTTSK